MAGAAPRPRRIARQEPPNPIADPSNGPALAHASRLIYNVCCLAGSASLIDSVRRTAEGRHLRTAIDHHDTAHLYGWLMAAVSHQGISDQVAAGYMDRHGEATWADLETGFTRRPSCPRLASYWAYTGCRYDKTSRTCTEPDHIDRCPLPRLDLRNGRLNQTAYALFLFIRDVAQADLVGWIDGQLARAADPTCPDHWSGAGEAVIAPLRHIYGISDKVLAMSLSMLLIAAPRHRPSWFEAGVRMIAVDSLVHNFLTRTGTLARFSADHPYGGRCYRTGGCADMVRAVADRIDARDFNPRFPKVFPRFVQHAIWRYCAQTGLDICNGNRIDDRAECRNIYCRLYSICDKRRLQIKRIT